MYLPNFQGPITDHQKQALLLYIAFGAPSESDELRIKKNLMN
jgi:hypothetical protein